MKESFVFYRSFYEGIKMLASDTDKVKAYEAIMELALNDNDTNINGVAAIIYTMAKPQILDHSQ